MTDVLLVNWYIFHLETVFFQADVSSLINFDDPTESITNSAPPDLLQFGNTPQKPASKSSQSSQNSTTFNIFGDTLMDFTETSTETSQQGSSTDMKTKIGELEETIRKYEHEINNMKTNSKDFQLSYDKLRAECDSKTMRCEKMENEIIKVFSLFLESIMIEIFITTDELFLF